PDPSEIRMLATDYDRTLTHPETLRLDQDTIDALQEARALGLKVVVISGRDMAFLELHMGPHVDALVGENGCFFKPGPDAEMECLSHRLMPLKEILAHTGLDISYGEAMADAPVELTEQIKQALGDHLAHVDLIPNRDRVMLLPIGIDKAAGIKVAADRFGLTLDQVAAAGDGENDLPLLGTAGYRIAVANAVPELKELAHVVTDEPGGVGLAHWIREVWIPAHRRGAPSAQNR
ncbi:MAG TPA: HAD family hydrolase, partial [Candidatus Thermoplasmatota archaeon]|nr:HAD family hydrolase [Candidatus Thermoplasmatota archaeon]